MVEFYFVRHGQTEWNSIRKLQGLKDSPLTQEGIEQAELLRKSIETISFTSCITSPLGRAYETAQILTCKDVPIIQNGLLTEMSFGKAEGLEKEVFKEKFPEPFFNLWHHADLYNPSLFDGETFESVVKRASQFLKSLHKYKAGSKIMIIGHGMMLKVIFGIIWKHDLEKFWEDPVPLNTSITKVVLEDEKFEIVDFSNVSHLKSTEVISYV